MIRLSEIQLFQLLKPKIGEQQAEAIVAYIDTRFKDNNEELYKRLASKEDLLKLEAKMENRMSTIETRISETKSDIQRWVFAFFFAIILAIAGLYFK
jgi:enoyl-[acyl-carrier-protein] reductase (NADH)